LELVREAANIHSGTLEKRIGALQMEFDSGHFRARNNLRLAKKNSSSGSTIIGPNGRNSIRGIFECL
jgi:hypothetical protein